MNRIVIRVDMQKIKAVYRYVYKRWTKKIHINLQSEGSFESSQKNILHLPIWLKSINFNLLRLVPENTFFRRIGCRFACRKVPTLPKTDQILIDVRKTFEISSKICALEGRTKAVQRCSAGRTAFCASWMLARGQGVSFPSITRNFFAQHLMCTMQKTLSSFTVETPDVV